MEKKKDLDQKPLEIFSRMEFSYPFRKYQSLILQKVDTTKDKDRKFHIVAPPGSGKTIVGIELIRRFGAPAVVFAPTSTIQLQWKEKVSMFIPQIEPRIELDEVVSIDPKTILPINAYTYQLISSPSENIQFVQEAAIFSWKDDMVATSIVETVNEADKRIEALKKNGVEMLKVKASKGRINLPALMKKLAKMKITSVLVEGGGEVIASALQAKVVDKMHCIIAPKIFGGRTAKTSVEGEGIKSPEQAWQLNNVKVERLGEDILVTGYLR